MEREKLLRGAYDIAIKEYPDMKFHALELYYSICVGNVSRMSVQRFAENFITDYMGSSYEEFLREYRWLEPKDTEERARKAIELEDIFCIEGRYYFFWVRLDPRKIKKLGL